MVIWWTEIWQKKYENFCGFGVGKYSIMSGQHASVKHLQHIWSYFMNVGKVIIRSLKEITPSSSSSPSSSPGAQPGKCTKHHGNKRAEMDTRRPPATQDTGNFENWMLEHLKQGARDTAMFESGDRRSEPLLRHPRWRWYLHKASDIHTHWISIMNAYTAPGLKSQQDTIEHFLWNATGNKPSKPQQQGRAPSTTYWLYYECTGQSFCSIKEARKTDILIKTDCNFVIYSFTTTNPGRYIYMYIWITYYHITLVTNAKNVNLVYKWKDGNSWEPQNSDFFLFC